MKEGDVMGLVLVAVGAGLVGAGWFVVREWRLMMRDVDKRFE
jgi:predicted transporter